MDVNITFLSLTGKKLLKIVVPDDTSAEFQIREAVRCAILRGADLRGADLRGADLRDANLSDASYAKLSNAKLSHADLSHADLSYADLSYADLSRAILSYAKLSNANLSGADLSRAILSYAKLSNAKLSHADLSHADLSYANLNGADLSDANLSRAILNGAIKDAKTILPHYRIAPEVGSFIAFKKLRNNVVATLEIPAEAKRTSSLIGRKCRAEFAKVVALSSNAVVGYAKHWPSGVFPYHVGEIVRPDSFDDDIRLECTNGIHFFMTRREAEEY